MEVAFQVAFPCLEVPSPERRHINKNCAIQSLCYSVIQKGRRADTPASQEVHPFPVVHPSLEDLPSQAYLVPQREAFPWEDAFLEACPLDLLAACPSEDPSVSCQVGLPCLGELPCPWEVVLHCQGACPACHS